MTSIAQARDSSRAKPVCLVQIALKNAGPTLYFSDRNITVGGQMYESYLHDLSGVAQELKRADSTAQNVNLELSFRNDKISYNGVDYSNLIVLGETYPFETSVCSIYEAYLDDNNNPSDTVLIFKGVLDCPANIDLMGFKCKVSTMPMYMDARWQQVQLDIVTFPAATDDVGKWVPIVYGSDILMPALRVDWSKTTLVLGTAATQTTNLELTNISGFPTSGQILIDEEVIGYNGITGNQLENISRGQASTVPQPHNAGADVIPYLASYDWVLSASQLSAVGDIFAEIDGKLWLVTAGVTVSFTNGFTMLQTSNVIALGPVLDNISVVDTTAVSDGISIVDGITVSNGDLAATNGNLALNDGITIVDGIEVSNGDLAATNGNLALNDGITLNGSVTFRDPGHSHTIAGSSTQIAATTSMPQSGSTMCIQFPTPPSQSLYYYSFSLTWQPALSPVGLAIWNCLSCPDGTLENELYSNGSLEGGSATIELAGISFFAEFIFLDFTNATQAECTGAWISGGPAAAATNTTGGEISNTLAKAGTVTMSGSPALTGAVAKSGTVTKNGTVTLTGMASKEGTIISTVLVERLHAVVNGYADDASGTYTGTPGAVIERPDSVIKHFLEVTSGIFGSADLDSASFSGAASWYASNGYALAFALAKKVKPSQWLSQLAYESRSTLVYNNGLWSLNVISDTAPAATATISKSQLAGKDAMFIFGKTDWRKISNFLVASYDEQYTTIPGKSQSGWLGTAAAEDTASQALYGIFKKEIQFEAVRTNPMAQSVLDHILLERRNPLLTVQFDIFWDNFDLAVGQTISIENDIYNGALFFIEEIRRKDAFRARVKATGWWS